jgi:hypothetical protein
MARIKLEYELDDLVSDGQITADDLAECLCDDTSWAADNLSAESVDKLRALIAVCDDA